MPITQDQLVQLQAKVATLVSDRGTADVKTAASNEADAASIAAAAVAAQARLDEASADHAVAADLTDLMLFVDNLAAPVPIVPPTPAPSV